MVTTWQLYWHTLTCGSLVTCMYSAVGLSSGSFCNMICVWWTHNDITTIIRNCRNTTGTMLLHNQPHPHAVINWKSTAVVFKVILTKYMDYRTIYRPDSGLHSGPTVFLTVHWNEMSLLKYIQSIIFTYGLSIFCELFFLCRRYCLIDI